MIVHLQPVTHYELSSALVVRSTLDLRGNGATLENVVVGRVMEFASTARHRLTVNGVTFMHGFAPGGGGLLVDDPDVSVTIIASTFDSNGANNAMTCARVPALGCNTAGGGAIFSYAPLSIYTSTFTRNSSADVLPFCGTQQQQTPMGTIEVSGCIYPGGGAITGVADVHDSTFSNNSSRLAEETINPSSAWTAFGTGPAVHPGVGHLTNVIVDGNFSPQIVGPETISASALLASIAVCQPTMVLSPSSTSGVPVASETTLGGYNVASDTTCGPAQPSDLVTDQATLRAGLSSLSDHGGPTATKLPTATSPVLDRILVGPDGRCVVGVPIDQRNQVRPSGSACDSRCRRAPAHRCLT